MSTIKIILEKGKESPIGEPAFYRSMQVIVWHTGGTCKIDDKPTILHLHYTSESPSILNRASNKQHSDHSVHLADKLVDVLLPVAVVTTLDVVLEFALTPATGRVGELEGP